jgi:lauroyl/myristoyl acyltransferase
VARKSGAAAYQLGYWGVSAFCETPVIRTALASQLSAINQFLETVAVPAGDRAARANEILAGFVWRRIWDRTLAALERPDFERLVRVKGPGVARALGGTGPVIMVHRHCAFAMVPWTWLKHKGQEPGPTIGIARWKYLEDKEHDFKDSALETARELKAAYDALKRGGRAHILPDGHIGQRGVTLPFMGRSRGFQPTFAQLALRIGAAVVPTDVTMSSDGSVDVEIGAPFEATTGTSDERVNHMIGLYADWLRRRYTEHPSSVAVPEIRKFLALPLAVAAGP